MPGKEVTEMNAVIMQAYSRRERIEALNKSQGLYFICSNKIMRKRYCVNVRL